MSPAQSKHYFEVAQLHISHHKSEMIWCLVRIFINYLSYCQAES